MLNQFRAILFTGLFLFLMVTDGVVNAAVPLTRPVKIMLMGDSITAGLCDGRVETCQFQVSKSCLNDLNNSVNSNASGYRPYLKQALNHMGMNTDFVGTLSHPKVTPTTPGNHFSDPQHEGHGGWGIADLTSCISTWLPNMSPDVILLHIGTNDALQCRTGEQMDDSLRILLDAIYTYVPAGVKVVVAKVIGTTNPGVAPTGSNCPSLPGSELQVFNNRISATVAMQVAAGRSVSTVDMSNLLLSSDYSSQQSSPPASNPNGIHPNNSGYKKISKAWADALLSIGTQSESVTAYGKRWSFDKNGVYVGQSLLTSIPYYNIYICNGNPAPCKFDTRAFFVSGGSQYESITAYGRYWNFSVSGALISQGLLSSVPRYSNYVCAGQPAPCRFDSRSFATISDQLGDTVVESITAYGKYWNFNSAGVLVGQGTLPSVARYNTNICSGRPAPCTFDTRATVAIIGAELESIIGYGNYWNFKLDGSLQSQGVLSSTTKYGGTICLGQVAPCIFDSRAYQAGQ